MTVLAVSPHADDSEIGASSLLRFAHILLVTSDDRRRKEQDAANEITGAVTLAALDARDGETVPDAALVGEIEMWAGQLCPPTVPPLDVVLGPPLEDEHQDHRAVAAAIRSAFRRSRTSILEYETPSVAPGWTPNFYVRLSQRDLARQTDALQKFSSQSGPYLDGGWLRSRAVNHGMRAGYPMAQAFRIVRATATLGELWAEV